jgi:hypothetical protein
VQASVDRDEEEVPEGVEDVDPSGPPLDALEVKLAVARAWVGTATGTSKIGSATESVLASESSSSLSLSSEEALLILSIDAAPLSFGPRLGA